MSEVKEKLELPALSPIPKRGWWVVDETWTCYEFTVPKAFVSDLDTIPHVPGLYVLIKGRARWSSLLHDFLYSTGMVSRKEADDHFHKAMLEEGVPRRIAKLMYLAVRWFGASHYNRNADMTVTQRVKQRIADENGHAPHFDK